VLSYFFLQDFYPCLSVKFVTDVLTVGRKLFTGSGDLASWIFFMGVSILNTSVWVLVAMITTFRWLYYAKRNWLSVAYGQTLWDGK